MVVVAHPTNSYKMHFFQLPEILGLSGFLVLDRHFNS